jgi:hypothetical protein
LDQTRGETSREGTIDFGTHADGMQKSAQLIGDFEQIRNDEQRGETDQLKASKRKSEVVSKV